MPRLGIRKSQRLSAPRRFGLTMPIEAGLLTPSPIRLTDESIDTKGCHVASSNGKVAPADFPPPVDVEKEFVKRGLDGEDERIEIGVAIVGGGTAGLACANRLLQLLGEDPETMEKLGEVPVAVIEKAKTCGGHNLSGAVMRPGPLGELFPDLSREQWRQQGFAFGEVEKEAIYALPNGKRSSASRHHRRSATMATR